MPSSLRGVRGSGPRLRQAHHDEAWGRRAAFVDGVLASDASIAWRARAAPPARRTRCVGAGAARPSRPRVPLRPAGGRRRRGRTRAAGGGPKVIRDTPYAPRHSDRGPPPGGTGCKRERPRNGPTPRGRPPRLVWMRRRTPLLYRSTWRPCAEPVSRQASAAQSERGAITAALIASVADDTETAGKAVSGGGLRRGSFELLRRPRRARESPSRPPRWGKSTARPSPATAATWPSRSSRWKGPPSRRWIVS